MQPSTPSESSAAAFWEGARSGVPIAIVSAPFGVLFGALAVQNGLTFFETVLMSATVYAGASQMVGIELFGKNIAPWLVVLSIFAVNFRHVLYSAAGGRRTRHWSGRRRAFAFFFLTDPQYSELEARAEAGRPVTLAWYLGLALVMYVFWIADGALGAYFGRFIPDTHALGLDFLLPIYFLGLVMGFRKRPLWLPVVGVSSVASIAAYHFVGSPWHVSLGAAAGIALAAIVTPSDAPAHSIEEVADE